MCDYIVNKIIYETHLQKWVLYKNDVFSKRPVYFSEWFEAFLCDDKLSRTAQFDNMKLFRFSRSVLTFCYMWSVGLVDRKRGDKAFVNWILQYPSGL